MFAYLFNPIRINGLEIKNRIAYPSLALLYSLDGRLNDRYFNYFRERARGGAGIVTVGPAGVDFPGSGPAFLSLASDDAIPAFAKLADIIKSEGARAWVQLFHAGAYSNPAMIGGEKPLAPSAEFCRYSRTTPKEMTVGDIESVQNAFADAAVRAREAGFDGVEIIGSAGYLISQFLSPLKNRRTDEYGGSFENRMRFPREVVESAREKLGPDFPLTIRMAGNDFVPGSLTDSETPEIAKCYEKAGADAINVTGGWHESRVPQLPMNLPRSAWAYLALNIKRAVSVPVMASNRISDPRTAEKIIKDGCADVVNLGRPLIADPEWPKKAAEGRVDEIRPCVACSQGCTDRIFDGKSVFCVGNPQAGFEIERRMVKTDSPKTVMIVGAGAAGMEAAVTAAKIGHKPELYEKSGDVGGQLWLAGAPPHKQEIWELIRFYKAMIRKHGIPVRLDTEVTEDLIREKNPGHLIIAEGAEYRVPPIPGADAHNVLSAWHVLRENPVLGKNVAIIGGGSVGLETAVFIASKGTITPEILYFLFQYDAEPPGRLRELMFKGTSAVTVFEMLPKSGQDVGKSTKWILTGNLRKFGVKVNSGAKVLSIRDGEVTWEKGGKEHRAAFDDIVVASGSASVRKLSGNAGKLGIPYTVAGDCVKPGKINDAIHGGFMAAIGI